MNNPFSQVKDLYKMQKEARKLQAELREKVLAGESKDAKIVIYLNAAQEFVDLKIDPSLLHPDASETIKAGFKQAFKDYQKKLQKTMMQDMDLNSIRSMLGK